MKEIKEFLNMIGVEAETIEAILAEEKGENFSLEELSKKFIEKQKSLSANDPELIKGLRDEIRGTELSKVEHKIKKQFGLSAEDVRDKKFEEILETAFQKIQADSGSSSEELQNKILELNKAVKQYEEEILPAERNKSKEEIATFRRDLAIRDVLSKKSLIVGTEVILPALNKTLNEYNIHVNESNEIEVKTKEGLKPLSKDGTKTLTFNEIVDRQLNEMNVIKQSNGNPNGTTPQTSAQTNGNQNSNGNVEPTYKLPGMKTATQNANSLKEMKTFGQ